MKKNFVLTLLMILLVTNLVGCGNIDEKTDETTPNVTSVTTAPTEMPAGETGTKMNSHVTVSEVVERYNSKIRTETTNASQEEISVLLVSYEHEEAVPQHNAYLYEYGTPNGFVGLTLMEDADTKEIIFGYIEMNKSFINSSNEEMALQAFMQMCYYITCSIDITITEDDFMTIWRSMRNNPDMQTFHSGVMYQVKEIDEFLTYSIKFD